VFTCFMHNHTHIHTHNSLFPLQWRRNAPWTCSSEMWVFHPSPVNMVECMRCTWASQGYVYVGRLPMKSFHMRSVGDGIDIANVTLPMYFPLVTHERKSTNHIAEHACISLVNTRCEIAIIPTNTGCQLYCVHACGSRWSTPNPPSRFHRVSSSAHWP